MARINIEYSVFSDTRFIQLVLKLGDQEKALGALVKLWLVAQQYWKKDKSLIPRHVWMTQQLNEALLELAWVSFDEQKNGYYAAGSEENFAWLIERVESGKRGGKKSAELRLNKINNLPSSKRKQTQANASKRNPPTPTLPLSHIKKDEDSSKNPAPEILSPSKVHFFISKYCEAFKFKYGSNPEITPRDSGIVKRIVKNLSEDNIQLYLDAYFSMPDSWLIKIKHPVIMFETKLNEIVVFAKSGKFTTLREAHQVDKSVAMASQLDRIRKGEL